MKTVLFVCTANIARSPIAEAIFNHLIHRMGLDGEFQAESAGTWLGDGAPAPKESQEVMEARGIDISCHVSRLLTESILEQADLVLTMEAGHKEALKIEFPLHSDKIFMLSEMVDAEFDIDDPMMRGLERFEATAQELEKILEDGKERIFKLLEGVGN